jgi:hypothetical protein
MTTSKRPKTVPFSQVPIKGTFIRGVALYMKMSKTTAQPVAIRTFKGSGDRKKFGEEDQVEYITKIAFRGSNGSSLSIS